MSYDEFPDPFEKRVEAIAKTLVAAAIIAFVVFVIKTLQEL